MAGGLLDELFVAIGFKVDDKGVKTLDTNLKQTLKSIAGFSAAVVAAVVVVDRMSTSLVKNNQAFISFNQQTGLAIGNLNKIAQAGMLANMNISAETVAQSLQAVQSNLAAIRLGQGNIAPFQMLGISTVGKDANQVFDEVREQIKGLDDMTATNIIQQMGFNPEMITVLRMTNEELAETQKLMLSPENRKKLKEYASGLRKVHMEFSLMKDQALVKIMPVLIDVEQGFKSITQVVFNVGDALFNLTSKFPGLKAAFTLLALGIITAFNPLLAAVSAIYMVIEDIAVWATGGKSAIGTSFDWLADKMNLTNNAAAVAGGGTMANINSAQNNTQNNYINVPNGNAEQIAKNTNDLQWAMMQVDRSK